MDDTQDVTVAALEEAQKRVDWAVEIWGKVRSVRDDAAKGRTYLYETDELYDENIALYEYLDAVDEWRETIVFALGQVEDDIFKEAKYLVSLVAALRDEGMFIHPYVFEEKRRESLLDAVEKAAFRKEAEKRS